MKIGVCGLLCEKCPLFIKKKCQGCKPNEFCPLPECAKSKNVKLCFECEDFPCKKNFEEGPIAKELLKHWRDNR